MFINIINSYRYVVAICDSYLIGKKFEEQNKQLDIKENFYKGEEKDPEKILELIQTMSKEDATFNIVGKQSIDTAIKAGIISSNNILKIAGIPYSMVLL